MDQKTVISVGKLNKYVSAIIREDAFLSDICVQGELSNVSKSPAGHIYFSLKDEDAVVKCALFAGNAMRLGFVLKDGMKVLVYGDCTLYEKTGSFQIVCRKVEEDGIGKLYEEFEKLKRKLDAEGLFNQVHKKQIPFLPKGVGVCTSAGGAAIHDIESTIGRRFPGMPIYLYSCPVQGKEAPPLIINALKEAENEGKCDVIIVGRGGGSLEDLWAFNDEALARAIYECRVPVISAVGHEIDYSISDFVADLRAETPTAAAERAVPVRADLEFAISNMAKRMQTISVAKLNGYKKNLAEIKQSAVLRRPSETLNIKHLDLEDISHRITNSLIIKAKAESAKVHDLEKRLASINVTSKVVKEKTKTEAEKATIKKVFESDLVNRKNQLNVLREKLAVLGPESVLGRGYSVLIDKDGNAVTSKDGIAIGEEFKVKLKDGSLDAKRI